MGRRAKITPEQEAAGYVAIPFPKLTDNQEATWEINVDDPFHDDVLEAIALREWRRTGVVLGALVPTVNTYVVDAANGADAELEYERRDAERRAWLRVDLAHWNKLSAALHGWLREQNEK